MYFYKLSALLLYKLQLMFKTAHRHKNVEFNWVNNKVPPYIEATHAHEEAKFPSDAVTY